MKWIIIALNVGAIALLIAISQYARGYHNVDVEDAYQGLVSRGLLDEAKVRQYAESNNGWHPRERFRSIGAPTGFLWLACVIGVAACVVNSAAVLWLLRKQTHV